MFWHQESKAGFFFSREVFLKGRTIGWGAQLWSPGRSPWPWAQTGPPHLCKVWILEEVSCPQVWQPQEKSRTQWQHPASIHWDTSILFCVIMYHKLSYLNKTNLTQVRAGWVWSWGSHQTEIKVPAWGCNSHLRLRVFFQIHWKNSVPCGCRTAFSARDPTELPEATQGAWPFGPWAVPNMAVGFLPDQQEVLTWLSQAHP